MELNLSACIVTYNDCDEALQAAASVLEHTRRHPLTLYLVDNASPDGTGDELHQALKDGRLRPAENQTVRVVCRARNGGFGAGHNTVLPELASDYHFILNPDIQLTADTLSDLAEWMEAHPQAVMARPSLCFPDGRTQVLPLRRCSLGAMIYRQLSVLTFLKKYNDAYVMAGEDLSAPRQIEFCTGSFSAVKTSAFRAAAGFDEGYFMYVEDADLTQKMLRQGQVWLVPQFSAIHLWHRAAHRSLGPMIWQARSLCRYFRKWGFAW
ncbi:MULTISPECIES: glycosyltransferase [unclassified Faecalibacterium]|uniref:glycosyltransferase n=1 Tax=unclassified Faecalibacterium TaxID=2646395 RepID=UPI001FA91A0E|nr:MULTISPECIES: glycosyltransferase [unclassified Faecalibacterium]